MSDMGGAQMYWKAPLLHVKGYAGLESGGGDHGPVCEGEHRGFDQSFKGKTNYGRQISGSQGKLNFQGHPPLNRGMASSQGSCKTGRVGLGGGNERRFRC